MATLLPRKLKHEEDRGEIEKKEIKVCTWRLALGVHQSKKAKKGRVSILTERRNNSLLLHPQTA